MIGVLIWLSLAGYVALVATLRVALATTEGLLRIRPAWFGIAMLAVLSDQIEPLEGYNDPGDPLAVIPRVVKWAWFAGLAGAVPHPARFLAVPLLAVAYLTAVGYLIEPSELLLYSGATERTAWLADRVTLGLVHGLEIWTDLGLDAAAYPTHVLAYLMMAFAQWLTPSLLLLLLGWCYLLYRSAATNTPGVTPPARLPLAPLGPLGASLALGTWLVAPLLPLGGFELGLADIGGVIWLLHLLGTARWLARRPGARRWIPPAVVLLFVLPRAAGLVLGLTGAGLIGWGVGLIPRTARGRAVALTRWSTIAAGAALYVVMRQTDLVEPDPLPDPPRSEWVEEGPGRRSATHAEATRICQADDARLCTIGEWHGAPGIGAERWEWVLVQANDGLLPALARTFQVGYLEVPLAAVTALRGAVEAEEVSFRCCR